MILHQVAIQDIKELLAPDLKNDIEDSYISTKERISLFGINITFYSCDCDQRQLAIDFKNDDTYLMISLQMEHIDILVFDEREYK